MTQSKGQTPENQAPDCRVLLVEDHADSADIVRRALQSFLNVRCTCAECLLEAQRVFKEAAGQGDDFDVVICDWVLPDGSGLELCALLTPSGHKQRFDGRTFWISMSAMASLDDAATSAAAGFDAHLRKPFGIQALVSVVRSLLERADCSEERAGAQASA